MSMKALLDVAEKLPKLSDQQLDVLVQMIGSVKDERETRRAAKKPKPNRLDTIIARDKTDSDITRRRAA